MHITFKNVWHTYFPGTYSKAAGLKGVCLHIEPGEIVAIAGHAGAGKSTLLQHINGLLKPTRGNVLVDGIYTTSRNFVKIRRRIGLVMQYPEQQLFEETVYKDIAFALRSDNLSYKEIGYRVHEAVEQVGLDKGILDASPFELSDGQKRRVAIAGVLIRRPEVLMLDEPTVGLDSFGHDIILNLIQDLNKVDRVTVILVTHNMEDVVKVAQRLVMLNDGTVRLDICTQDMFDHRQQIEESGLLLPVITQLMYSVKELVFPDIDWRVSTVDNAKAQLVKFMRRRKQC